MFCTVVVCWALRFFVFFFFKQKTAYEMRISDWSSDVCSSDLNSFSSATVSATVAVLFASSQRAKPRNKKAPSTGSDRHESRIRSLQNEIPQEPVCGQAQEACLHAPLRGRGGLLQGHGQRRRRSVPKPDQFVLAGLCHEASQGEDYLAEQQGLTIRSSRELRRSGLPPRRLLPPPRRIPRPTGAPTAPARPTPPLPTQSPQSPSPPN